MGVAVFVLVALAVAVFVALDVSVGVAVAVLVSDGASVTASVTAGGVVVSAGAVQAVSRSSSKSASRFIVYAFNIANVPFDIANNNDSHCLLFTHHLTLSLFR